MIAFERKEYALENKIHETRDIPNKLESFYLQFVLHFTPQVSILYVTVNQERKVLIRR